MGIRSFFGFGQARDKPTNTAGSGYSFMFGRTTRGKPVNERTMMRTSFHADANQVLVENANSETGSK